MEEKANGSLETLHSLQISKNVEGMDAISKDIFKNKEVLAVLLKGVVEEYQDYTLLEIMDFIEADSITEDTDVSVGRTNTRIQGSATEFTQLNEKTSNFDILFVSKNPRLSSDVQVNLHIDIEPQGSYTLGYPIEKRGMYYLSRALSSQLSLVTDRTDYSSLEKCYSIWICRDNVPVKERYSISHYNMENTKNFGICHPEKQNYDLLSLIIIRLGSAECPVKDDVLEFLSTLFYPQKQDFLDTIQRYIDFSQNEELRQEVVKMSGLGMSILMEGMEQGIERGEERGRAHQILDSISNLMKAMDLSLEEACKVLNINMGDYEHAKKIIRQSLQS